MTKHGLGLECQQSSKECTDNKAFVSLLVTPHVVTACHWVNVFFSNPVWWNCSQYPALRLHNKNIWGALCSSLSSAVFKDELDEQSCSQLKYSATPSQKCFHFVCYRLLYILQCHNKIIWSLSRVLSSANIEIYNLSRTLHNFPFHPSSLFSWTVFISLSISPSYYFAPVSKSVDDTSQHPLLSFPVSSLSSTDRQTWLLLPLCVLMETREKQRHPKQGPSALIASTLTPSYRLPFSHNTPVKFLTVSLNCYTICSHQCRSEVQSNSHPPRLLASTPPSPNSLVLPSDDDSASCFTRARIIIHILSLKKCSSLQYFTAVFHPSWL